jgi:hypothetical protein
MVAMANRPIRGQTLAEFDALQARLDEIRRSIRRL